MDLLPAILDDPFERILVAQAQREGLTLLTANEIIDLCPVAVRVVPAPLATLAGEVG